MDLGGAMIAPVQRVPSGIAMGDLIFRIAFEQRGNLRIVLGGFVLHPQRLREQVGGRGTIRIERERAVDHFERFAFASVLGVQRAREQIQSDVIVRIRAKRVTKMPLRVGVSPQLMALQTEPDVRRKKSVRIHLIF
jgi:hypothetical protein